MLTNLRTILIQKSQLNTNTYLYLFELLEPKEIDFNPGQYLILKVPSSSGPVSRLYSIASSNKEKNKFELIIQIIPNGIASNYLSGLEVKDEVIFYGPAGLFNLEKNNRQKIFLTTGTGIAPIISMLRSYELPTMDYRLFWGIRNFKDAYLFEELKKYNLKIYLSREKNLDVIAEVDKNFFDLGRIDLFFNKLQATNNKLLTNTDYYLCGRRQTVESLKQFLLDKNIQIENIHFEKF